MRPSAWTVAQPERLQISNIEAVAGCAGFALVGFDMFQNNAAQVAEVVRTLNP
jgi:hypothetical protein